MTSDTVGAHVYWTRPRSVDMPKFSDLDWCVLAVSAIVWRALNGPAWLFTDQRGRDEIEVAGLLPLWDRVDVDCLEQIPKTIHAPAFWDFGKTVALCHLPASGCVLDLDLIVWDHLLPSGSGAVSFLHWETPVMPWYPGPDGLSVPTGYTFDPSIEWDTPVCNTAFLRCPDPVVRQTFLENANRFASGNRPTGSGIAEMLFAGQRSLAHVIRVSGTSPQPLIDYLYVPCGESRWLNDPLPVDDPLAPEACDFGVPFTHLWRHKHMLRKQPAATLGLRERLVSRCRERAGAAFEHLLSALNSSKKVS